MVTYTNLLHLSVISITYYALTGNFDDRMRFCMRPLRVQTYGLCLLRHPKY